MKAKVIATGEIIDCFEYSYDVDGRFYMDENTEKEYHECELEFIKEEVSIKLKGFVNEDGVPDFIHYDWMDLAKQLGLQPNDEFKITISKKVYYE